MANLIKRPIIIQDLIAHATYISLGNLEAGDRYDETPLPSEDPPS
jgi:hypothetical protein